ncbi:MAG: 2-amino-4-hydroxy-6-hydroxymethyldihydropteridine diphosphokinase [Pseudomonadota bacterium]|jgi:2-amino-4-hydroxy-6-hydroxymethyldihydropteridine diphosphokinase
MPMQPGVLNAVVAARYLGAPAALLRIMQRIEHQAGRSRVKLSRSRCLDLDLIAVGGRVQGWPDAKTSGDKRGRLVLPHPFAHRRGFVLVPLNDVAPSWVHPVFGVRATTLLRRIPRLGLQIAAEQWVDLNGVSCHNCKSGKRA